MKIIILADFKTTADTKFWLKEELDKFGYDIELRGIPNYNVNDEVSSFGKIKIWYKYFRLSLSGIKRTEKYDIIITDNFVIGAMAAFFCQIFYCKRKIIALNMIAHQKGILNKIFRKIVYNKAFKYKTFWFSVNDEQLITNYAAEFKFSTERIFILHDAIHAGDEISDYREADDFIFTGGDAFRDWENVIKCALDLPGIRFVGVARHKYFPVKKELPPNLKMHFDIPNAEFYTLLKKSKIIFLPLNSRAPCGLIVMMKAGLLSKPVIITETPSTRNYIQNEISGSLIKMQDIEDMKNSILTLYNSSNLRERYAMNLKNRLLTDFSTEKSAQIINQIIMQ
jgi:glycosyltransferase involved in cell wall biosynthesis